MSKVVYRQGDVALVKTTKQTGKLVNKGRVVLAVGEATGHNHIVEGAVAEFEVDGKRLLWVEAPAPLVHPEHATVEVEPGFYWVVPQREYSPQTIRHVVD